MEISLLIMSGWVIMGNIWHAILISNSEIVKRPRTISEHAVQSSRFLLIHRIVHSLPLILFVPVFNSFLLPQKYYFAACMLFAAVVFDSVQTLTLNKNTASLGLKLNTHIVTAWLMAFSYLSYTITISQIAMVSPLIYGPLLSICVVLVIFSKRGLSTENSLVMQMSYFLIVSLVSVMANIKLIFL